MFITRKINEILTRRRQARERKRQESWERQIQIEALESMVPELGRQLAHWQKRLDAIQDRQPNGVPSQDDQALANGIVLHINILRAQRDQLQRELAYLKGVA